MECFQRFQPEISARVDSNGAELAGIRTDVAGNKSDVAGLKSDFTELKQQNVGVIRLIVVQQMDNDRFNARLDARDAFYLNFLEQTATNAAQIETLKEQLERVGVFPDDN